MSFKPSLLLVLVGIGCSAPGPVPGVVRSGPGERLTHIPGPMPGFGPFRKYSDALVAACPFILDKPHASAGHPGDPNFNLYWQLSTEYCAWLYRTPDGLYEMSMLASSAVQDEPTKRRCDLPVRVDDPRHPADSLGYLFVLHNHPYMDTLTEQDIRFIVDVGRIHGFEVQTENKRVPLSIVAFYAESRELPARCGGFFQYAPLNGQIFKWTPDEHGSWKREPLATVKWTGPDAYTLERI